MSSALEILYGEHARTSAPPLIVDEWERQAYRFFLSEITDGKLLLYVADCLAAVNWCEDCSIGHNREISEREADDIIGRLAYGPDRDNDPEVLGMPLSAIVGSFKTSGQVEQGAKLNLVYSESAQALRELIQGEDA